MNRKQHKEALIRFLQSIQRPELPIEEVDDEDRLVEVGLIDSLSVLQIVIYLEETYGISFSETGVDPEELGSIASILDLIEHEA